MANIRRISFSDVSTKLARRDISHRSRFAALIPIRFRRKMPRHSTRRAFECQNSCLIAFRCATRRRSVTKVIYLGHLAAYPRNCEEYGMSEVIDNKANRIRVMKDIIKHLHAGNL
jgi:hypothetical protein